MERELKINYHWKRVNASSEEVIEHHKEFLEETALEHITQMIMQGFRSGELTDNIHCEHDEDDHDGEEYQGWWSVEKN